MDKNLSWIRDCTRRLMVGFHVPDYDQIPEYRDLQRKHGLAGILERVDPRSFVRDLREAHVQAFWFYGKCHYGNAYYPSRVGHVHSALDDRDLFGELVEACRSEGIVPLCVYEFSDLRMPKDHPDWCHTIPADAQPDRLDATDAVQGSRVEGPCLNGPYGEFVIEQVREIVTAYPVRGFYIDFLGLFGFEDWRCPYCEPRLRAALGFDFRGVSELSHEQYVRYVQWRYAENDRYAKQVRKIIKDLRPDIAFTHNFHGSSDGVGMQRTDFAAENCDFLSGDLFHLRAGMLQMSWKIRGYAAASRMLPAEVLLDSTIAVRDDFSTPKMPDSYDAELWTARSSNAATCTSIIMNIDGTVDPHIIALNRKLYAEHKAYEPWLSDMQPLAQVGILRSHQTLEYRPRTKDTVIDHPHHALEFEGWVQTLIAGHQLWDVVKDHQITRERLRRFRVLVLPAVSCLDELQAEAIRQFVEEGGVLVATADTSLYDAHGNRRQDFQLASVLGVQFTGRRRQDRKQVELTGELLPVDEPWTSNILYFSDGQLAVEPEPDTRVLGRILNKPKIAIVNVSLPTDMPALVEHTYGKGRCYYFAGAPGLHFRCFGQGNTGKAMKALIARAVGDRAPVTVEAPATMELFAHRQKGKKHVVVNLVNALPGVARTAGVPSLLQYDQTSGNPVRFDETEHMPCISRVVVSFRVPRGKKIKRVYLPPRNRRLAHSIADGCAHVVLRNVGVHAMVVAEFELFETGRGTAV